VYADVCLAWVDLLSGQLAEAGYTLGRDPAETAVVPWIDALYHYVRAEWHRKEGRPDEALAMLEHTRAAVDGGVYDESLAMLDVAEARALLDLGAPDRALRVLARISGVEGAIGRQAAAVQLVAVLDAPVAELEYATWRVVRRAGEGLLDPGDVVQALWSAGDRLHAAKRLAAADGAHRAARRLAGATLRAADPDVRARLALQLGPALAPPQRRALTLGETTPPGSR